VSRKNIDCEERSPKAIMMLCTQVSEKEIPRPHSPSRSRQATLGYQNPISPQGGNTPFAEIHIDMGEEIGHQKTRVCIHISNLKQRIIIRSLFLFRDRRDSAGFTHRTCQRECELCFELLGSNLKDLFSISARTKISRSKLVLFCCLRIRSCFRIERIHSKKTSFIGDVKSGEIPWWGWGSWGIRYMCDRTLISRRSFEMWLWVRNKSYVCDWHVAICER
jgi:hypothetical protein